MACSSSSFLFLPKNCPSISISNGTVHFELVKAPHAKPFFTGVWVLLTHHVFTEGSSVHKANKEWQVNAFGHKEKRRKNNHVKTLCIAQNRVSKVSYWMFQSKLSCQNCRGTFNNWSAHRSWSSHLGTLAPNTIPVSCTLKRCVIRRW